MTTTDALFATSEDLSASKASMIRGVHAVLKSKGQLDAVCATLPPHVQVLLRNPPPSSMWLKSEPVRMVIEAYGALYGPRAARELLRDGVLEVQIPLLMPLIGGFIRLFGATPHTLLSRLNESMAMTSRGVDVTYRHESSKCARLLYCDKYQRNLAPVVFHAVAGALEIPFHLCKVQGSVSDPVLIDDGRGNSAEYTIRWT